MIFGNVRSALLMRIGAQSPPKLIEGKSNRYKNVLDAC